MSDDQTPKAQIDSMQNNYQVVYADPPWDYKSDNPTMTAGGKSGYKSLSPEYYYGTMTLDEVKRLPVPKISALNSVLFLWTTNPMLREGLEVMAAWGFDYVTTITWFKTNSKGMGYWFRGYTEHLLFGKKGNVKSFRSQIHNLQEAKFTHHSEKPDLFRRLIEDCTPYLNPKIELFARKRVQGWDAWGNQLDAEKQTRLGQTIA